MLFVEFENENYHVEVILLDLLGSLLIAAWGSRLLIQIVKNCKGVKWAVKRLLYLDKWTEAQKTSEMMSINLSCH